MKTNTEKTNAQFFKYGEKRKELCCRSEFQNGDTEKEMKKIISFALCILMIVSAVNLNYFESSAASSVSVSELTALAKKFPNGKYWNHVGSENNNPDGYTDYPCTHHGSACKIKENACDCNFYNNAIQCAGYAYKISSEIVGTPFSTWKKSTDKLDPAKLYVGDIIRYLKTPTSVGHSVTVVGISGDTIAYTGANWGSNCLIRWSKATVDKFINFDYVLHDPNNKMKSSNVTFFEGLNSIDNSKKEIWKMQSDANLNVREKANTSSAVKWKISAGSQFSVTEKVDDGAYLWGKVSNGSQIGWAALNYATYLSGEYKTVQFEKLGIPLASQPFNIKWQAYGGAKEYSLEIYNSNNEKIKTVNTSGTSTNYTFSSPGKYYLKLIAKNSRTPSWKMQSSKASITVLTKPVGLQSITLESNLKMTVGSSVTPAVKLYPENSTDRLLWKSNDSTTAKVDQNGKITALKSGNVVVECYSAQDNSVFAITTVSITPSAVSGFEQSLDTNSAKSVSLKWNKVSGASGYRVYRTTASEDLKLVAQTNQTSFTENNLSYAANYTYSIRAYQTVGEKNYFGEYTKTEAITAPSKVTNLTLSKVTGETFDLKWDKTAGATSYVLYRLDKATGNYAKYKTAETNSATISGKSGTVYTFKVAAIYTHGGKSAESVLSAGTDGFVKPGKVKNFTQDIASSSSQSVKLKWDKVPGANGYRIYRITSTGRTKFLLQTDRTDFTEKNLAFANTYTYLIKAYQTVGGKTYYGDLTTMYAVTSPEKVLNLKVQKITETSYELKWDKSPGSTSYAVYRYDEKAGKYVKYKTVKTNSLSLTGKAGSVKSFKVAAVYSDSSKTIGSALSSGVYAFVKPKKVSASAQVKSRTVTLKWKSVSGATSYEVFMKDGSDFVKIGTASKDKLTFTKTGLKPNRNYYFKVRTVTKKGTTVANGACSAAIKIRVK